MMGEAVRRQRFVRWAALVVLGGGCGGEHRPSGGTGGAGGDGTVVFGNRPGVGGAGGSGSTLPQITFVDVPAKPSGTIPLTVNLVHPQSEAITVTLELADETGTYRRAHIEGRAGPFPANPRGTWAVVYWDSLKDIGFRDPKAVTLRLTPADASVTGDPVTVVTPVIDNLRAAARRVKSYMITYGALDADTMALAKAYQLVIIHPSQGNFRREVISELQNGVDPDDPADDVIVLGYVSVGEDLRTQWLSDDQLRTDPRFRGDGTGPRIDPRGPNADGQRLTGIDPRGAPSNGGAGFASYYLDDNSVDNSPTQTGDGLPDRNSIFGGCFVNAGDPAWFDVINNVTRDSPDHVPGLREVMTTDYGRGLGCDGVFLDTIDTAAPNSFTDSTSYNQSEFEWTAPGFSAFIRHVHEAYPNRLLLQNRGVFFFDPRKPAYEFTTRGSIDFSLYESFRLDSSDAHLTNYWAYPDNRYNYAPKIMVEANRPDGFVPLSLDYAEGPPDQMSKLTLVGQSTLGYDELLEDIRVAQNLTGFRHYITDFTVLLVNDFVRKHADWEDHTPPVWSSTYNDTSTSPPSSPTPRVGIQQAVLGPTPGSVVVRWDVALDLNRVGYALYYRTTPFDFAADPGLTQAARIVLSPEVGEGYVLGVGPGVYPFQQTVAVPPGATYYLVIRAFDDSPDANEDTNTTTLAVTVP